MATDKNLYQKISPQGQSQHPPPTKSSRKPLLCLLIICIIAISSVYSLSFRSSPAQVKAFASPSEAPSSEKPASQAQQTQRARPKKVASENLNIDVDEITKLKMQLKKRMVQASSLTEQTFPMLVSLEVKDLELDYRAPIDLVCVIDHSGSMSGEKMELVKNTFKYLVHFLNDQDRLSIVLFDDQVSTLLPLTNTTKQNKDLILSAVRTVEARGGTIINGGLKQAIDILNQREIANQVTGIFLLSDGLDNMGNHQARSMIKETFLRSGLDDGGVIIHTFGFGRDHDPELMTGIADLTDGNFFFIDKLDQVDEAFVESLGALQTSVAENVQFFIKPEQSEYLQGVEIVKAYGDESMWKQEGPVFITKSPSLITGRQKDFVLELKVPKVAKALPDIPEEVKVASCQVILSLADGRQVIKNADLKINLISEDADYHGIEEDNQEVMKNYYRVKGAMLMQEAGGKADEGKYEEARQILKDFKESVEGSAVKDDELIKGMMLDMEKSMEYVSEDAYGSYGRQNLIGNKRAFIRQQGNLDSSVLLTNTHILNMREILADL